MLNDTICHNGLELSINSDVDEEEFPDSNDAKPKAGEVVSSSEEEEEQPVPAVKKKRLASKVVKVGKNGNSSDMDKSNDRFSKFSHLKNYPEFKSFLS